MKKPVSKETGFFLFGQRGQTPVSEEKEKGDRPLFPLFPVLMSYDLYYM